MVNPDPSTIFKPEAVAYFFKLLADRMVHLDPSTILTPEALLLYNEWRADRQRTTPKCTQNLGDPPAKTTNMEPLNRKRKNVPRKSLVVQDLEKRLRTQKLSDKATNKLVKIEKLMKELNAIVENMKRENIETGTIKEVELKTQQINEIERNIEKIKEDAAKDRSTIDDEIKQWQLNEEAASIEAQKSIDEKQKELAEKKKQYKKYIKEIKKTSETLKKAIDELNKRELKEEISIKCLEEKKARMENGIKELVKRRQELKENIQFIQNVHTHEAENVSHIQTLQRRYTGEEYERDQPGTSYVPGPSTSRNYIEAIELANDETHTANDTACLQLSHPGYWSRSDRD